MTNLMNEEKSVVFLCPKAFDFVSHNILIDKLMAYMKRQLSGLKTN